MSRLEQFYDALSAATNAWGGPVYIGVPENIPERPYRSFSVVRQVAQNLPGSHYGHEILIALCRDTDSGDPSGFFDLMDEARGFVNAINQINTHAIGITAGFPAGEKIVSEMQVLPHISLDQEGPTTHPIDIIFMTVGVTIEMAG